VNDFESYCKLYPHNSFQYAKINKHWEVAISDNTEFEGFEQVSFCNSINTSLGGKHVDHVANQIVKQYIEKLSSDNPTVNIKPFYVKNNLKVFVNALIVNPTFTSQTKENMTLTEKKFKKPANINKINFVLPELLTSMENLIQQKSKRRLDTSVFIKDNAIKNIKKLDDARFAGSDQSELCTLIITEGDSAKTTAVSGLSVVGRDHFGVYPVRGKLLNVRDASTDVITNNKELKEIAQILGLRYGQNYTGNKNKLRYGKLMIMTDQDHDGAHIKGLLINYIHTFWPDLLKEDFIDEFITPLIKVSKKGKPTHSFYTDSEYKKWHANEPTSKTWNVKYYKGLGTSDSKEAKQYFSDMPKHRISLEHKNINCDKGLELAFAKKQVENRKLWLLEAMENTKNELNGENDLSRKNPKSFRDFIDNELVEFSRHNLNRAIPNIVDGFKPVQRKILWTMLNHNAKNKEIKVAQLAGMVAEKSAYHHGEVSMQKSIVKMAQNFVGTNNLNLLAPIGQFGSRLLGGEDASSPRYIFTNLEKYTRDIFPSDDDDVLEYLVDDNKQVEPRSVLGNGFSLPAAIRIPPQARKNDKSRKYAYFAVK